MKSFLTTALTLAATALFLSPAPAQTDASLKLEIKESLRRASAFLIKAQDAATGAIGEIENPAMTALSVTALVGDPNREPGATLPVAADKAYKFLASNAKDDGGIYVKGLMTYNTALSLTALCVHPKGEYKAVALKAKTFLIGQQQVTGDDKDGGIGYGGSSPTSDLSNTHFALEALYLAKSLETDTASDPKKETKLNYQAAIDFVSRCQNLKGKNDAAWVSEDETNKGGFIYSPGSTKAPEMKLPDGKIALRSYGSMGYAGLLSFIYADMDKKDRRVTAVQEWLKANYSVTENPGMEQQGLYYYYHTMAKAMSVMNVREYTLKDGRKVDWRQDLGKTLLNNQKADGSWVNPTGRWRENDPVYTTALGALALIRVYNAL